MCIFISMYSFTLKCALKWTLSVFDNSLNVANLPPFKYPPLSVSYRSYIGVSPMSRCSCYLSLLSCSWKPRHAFWLFHVNCHVLSFQKVLCPYVSRCLSQECAQFVSCCITHFYLSQHIHHALGTGYSLHMPSFCSVLIRSVFMSRPSSVPTCACQKGVGVFSQGFELCTISTHLWPCSNIFVEITIPKRVTGECDVIRAVENRTPYCSYPRV